MDADLNLHPIVRQYIEWNHFGDTIGMHFEIPKAGTVEYYLQVTDKILATPIAAHGGAIAGLVDATLGVAALSTVCHENRIVSTVSFTINYLRPCLLGDELVAHGEVVKSGKRLIFVEGKVINQRSEIVATASGILNAYPVEKVAR